MIDEIVAAAEGVLGPTNDAVGELAPFVDLPAVIPTPNGAEIVDFSVNVAPSRYYPHDSVTIVLSAPGTLTDIATFYATTLTAAGLRSCCSPTPAGRRVPGPMAG